MIKKRKRNTEIIEEILLEKEFVKLATKNQKFLTYQESRNFLKESGLTIIEAFHKMNIPIPSIPQEDIKFLTRISEEFTSKSEIEYAKEVLNQVPPNFRRNHSPTQECQHRWALYQGLSEKYEFCEICDEKK